MNLLVALEHRFNRLPDGSVWTNTFFARSFFERYLSVFSSVSVIARVAEVDSVPSTAKRADGEGVTFVPISYYVGAWEYLRKARQIRKDIAAAAQREGAVILRASSQIGNSLEPHLRSMHRPYALEIVGDPYDVYSPGAIRHPLRPFFRWWFPRILRRQCARASATAYVTSYALQKRYPPASGTFTTHYSSVELPQNAFAASPRSATARDRLLRILMVGTLEQFYKGPDVLIQAFAACLSKGLKAELHLLGGGRQMPILQELTRKLGVADRVHFLGSVSGGEAVREQLDAADLFVLPSRTEGLPRAMIEAMARGLPCIGSAVGGIPELLDADYLVPSEDPESLANKILWLANDPSQMQSASARNLERAHDYSEEILAKRRFAFYQYVRETTAASMSAGKCRASHAEPVHSKCSEDSTRASQ